MNLKRMIIIIMLSLVLLAFVSNWLYTYNVKMTGSNSADREMTKVCYLTFDDGPSYNTEKVLNVLKKYDVKATFFLIGSEIGEDDGTIIARMKKEGHAIGLHSNVHDFDKIYTGVENCVKDYKEEQKRLLDEYGIATNLFRFPGGSACIYMNGQRDAYIDVMQENGFLCFDWHVSGEDSVGNPTVYSIQKNVADAVLKYTEPIILLHDSGIANVTVDALPGIIEGLKEKGYIFGTLDTREEYIFRQKH